MDEPAARTVEQRFAGIASCESAEEDVDQLIRATICGWLRRATALAGAVLIVACTARTGMSATGSHPAAQPPVVVAPADGCQLPVGNEPSPEGEIVLGIISLGPDFLQPAVPVHQRWWRYWQKHGLWIRAGHRAVTIAVPRAWRNRAAITWGVNVGIASTLRLPGCPAGPGQWNGYAGGFYLRSSSACVPLVISVGRRSAVVRVGVGRSCGTVP